MSIPKIVVIVGPTAVGKTDFALQLAKKIGGEIVSADSRQMYTGMTVGTGKPIGQWQQLGDRRLYMAEGVAHYGLDFLTPNTPFSAAEFKKYAYHAISDIANHGKVPIVVGGTGLYIRALIDNLEFPQTSENARAALEDKTLTALLEELQKSDPAGFAFVDKANKRRVVRALELARSGSSIANRKHSAPPFSFVLIGLTLSREELAHRINKRIDDQVAHGFKNEAVTLLSTYRTTTPSMSSIGYREWAAWQKGEMSEAEAIRAIKTATFQYAKRQMTWFKRDERITWFSPGNSTAAEKLAEDFLA